MNYKEEFINIATDNIKRSGLVDLLTWMEGTDFYTAPASTRYHDCHRGGLVEHSIGVYNALCALIGVITPTHVPSSESLAITALFHDICKIGCYKTETRWRKDINNKWESYTTYKFEEDFAYGGHGSKSVFLLQSFIKLTPEEASAINCHMGFSDSSTYSNPSEVYDRNDLAWLLHVADEAATYNKIKWR